MEKEIVIIEARHSKNILLVIGFLTFLLLSLATFLAAHQSASNFSSGTPEHTVQQYLRAVLDGRNDVAASYFSTDSICEASDIDRAYIARDFRVSLLNTDINGDRAYVKINVSYASGGPFDSGYFESQTYRMIKESTGWRILGIPWPLYDCGIMTS